MAQDLIDRIRVASANLKGNQVLGDILEETAYALKLVDGYLSVKDDETTIIIRNAISGSRYPNTCLLHKEKDCGDEHCQDFMTFRPVEVVTHKEPTPTKIEPPLPPVRRAGFSIERVMVGDTRYVKASDMNKVLEALMVVASIYRRSGKQEDLINSLQTLEAATTELL